MGLKRQNTGGHLSRVDIKSFKYALVAQLDRVLGYEPSGRRFESSRVRHKIHRIIYGGFYRVNLAMTNEFQQLINNITPEIYQNLKTAVEIGRWPTGAKLTPDQRQMSLQAVIAYEIKHVPAEERIGYVPPAEKTGCKNNKQDEQLTQNNLRSEPLNWV